MRVDRSKVIKNLPKKGFRKDNSRSHIYFYHEAGGKETGPYTYVSHSKKDKEISGGLLKCMRKQLGLDTIRQTIDLIECPMDGDGFNSILKDKGIT